MIAPKGGTKIPITDRMNSWAGNSYWNRFQKFMIQPSTPKTKTIETTICKKYFILSHMLNVMLLWSVNSYLASFRSTPFHMTPFLAPAPEGPLVFTSPHSLPSLAFPLPWACGLPCSVLVGASSVRGISATSRLVPVRCFAFPVRRENIIANSLIVSQYKFAYSIITR